LQKTPKNASKNGALPFTICEGVSLTTEIAWKTEHCRSLREMEVAVIKMLATEKRSISVHISRRMSVRVKKRSIAVHFSALF